MNDQRARPRTTRRRTIGTDEHRGRLSASAGRRRRPGATRSSAVAEREHHDELAVTTPTARRRAPAASGRGRAGSTARSPRTPPPRPGRSPAGSRRTASADERRRTGDDVDRRSARQLAKPTIDDQDHGRRDVDDQVDDRRGARAQPSSRTAGARPDRLAPAASGRPSIRAAEDRRCQDPALDARDEVAEERRDRERSSDPAVRPATGGRERIDQRSTRRRSRTSADGSPRTAPSVTSTMNPM